MKSRNDLLYQGFDFLTAIVLIIAASLGVFDGQHTAFASSDLAHKQSSMQTKLATLSMPFIENQGQTADSVRFYANTFGGTVFVTQAGEMIYALPKSEAKAGRRMELPESEGGCVIKENFLNSRQAVIQGEGRASAQVNVFKGNDPKQWRKGLSTYDRVNLGQIYDGITLKLKAAGNNVEKLFYVAPGADSGQIRVKMDGVKGLSVNDVGELAVTTEAGEVRFSAPVAFQEIDGKQTIIDVAYSVEKDNTYGFSVASYDKSRELVIDPILASALMGGSGYDDFFNMAIDPDGNIYIVGRTTSSDLPQKTGDWKGSLDAFVSKLTPDLAGTIYTTYIGGSRWDEGRGIDVDNQGCAYATGSASFNNSDFPITAGETRSGVFVVKLDQTGSIVYSTCIGGSGYERGKSIVVDKANPNHVYLFGETNSTDLVVPTENTPYQPDHGGGGWASVRRKSGFDGFIVKLDISTTEVIYNTYIGGSGNDCLFSNTIAVDAEGHVYFACDTTSDNLPVKNALNMTMPDGSEYDGSIYHGGGGEIWGGSMGGDIFVGKLTPDGSDLVYGTYLGGTGYEEVYGFALDAENNLYVGGTTDSCGLPDQKFPTVNPLPGHENKTGPPSTVDVPDGDSFIAKLRWDSAAAKLTLDYSTYIGGSSSDFGANGIAIVDTDNSDIQHIYVTGNTRSDDFFDDIPVSTVFNGLTDGYLTRLIWNKACSELTMDFGEYIGGTLKDYGRSIILDDEGSIYIGGSTYSIDDFPADSRLGPTGGDRNAYVIKMNVPNAATVPPASLTKKAIIVAGGGNYISNGAWTETKENADVARFALHIRGYPSDSISYLSPDNNSMHTDLQNAMQTWAKADAQNLLLYMVNHGDYRTFELDGTTTPSEMLTAEELNIWSNNLQATMPEALIFVYDACYSGSFIPVMNQGIPCEKERVIITSAEADELSIMAGPFGDASFSWGFWSNIGMRPGITLNEAFDRAREWLQRFVEDDMPGVTVTPCLDANGDGVPNKDHDYYLADQITIEDGNAQARSSRRDAEYESPHVGSMSDEQILCGGETSATLRAWDIHSDHPIGNVVASIVRPDFEVSPGEPISLPWVLLLDTDDDGVYEGEYDAFDVPGTYTVIIYAMDTNGIRSLPEKTTVIRYSDEYPNQTWYKDADDDGYSDAATATSCARPANHKLASELTATSGDCNDNDASVHPGATEICNGADDNCNGQTDEGLTITFYRDADGDGHGDPNLMAQACSQPTGHVSNNTDRDDSDPSVRSLSDPIAGVFTVDDGIITIDWLYDGGMYEGELGIFSLDGMEDLTPGSPDFIREAAGRAMSGTEKGCVVLSDRTEGARLSGQIGGGSGPERNSGAYKGLKTCVMTPGDTFATILVPNSTMENLYRNPNTTSPHVRPIFSIASPNPEHNMLFGQIAEIEDASNAFVYEDMPLSSGSDRDYNDLIVRITGITVSVPTLDNPGLGFEKDWRIVDNPLMPHIRVSPPNPESLWIVITLKSPADLLVYDPEGRVIGKEGGYIPGATFGFDENGHQIVSLPALEQGDYRIVLRAKGDGGLCHLEIKGMQGHTEVSSLEKPFEIAPHQTFKTIISADSFLNTRSVNFETPTVPETLEGEPLVYDFDGNGKIDNSDINRVSSLWNMCEDDPEFDPFYDIDGDKCITILDIMPVVNGR